MLEIRELHISRGGKSVVHGVDLDVAPGEIVAMLGPNGAGKSSIVLALAGAIPRSKGHVRIGGATLDGLTPDAVRRAGLAIVPEGHQVLGSLSVLDNLRAAAMVLPANEVGPAIERVLMTFPELTPRLEHLGRSLSGGQKQMVCMAQALLARPRILVVDELSLGLAPLVVKRLADVLQSVAADGVGVLLIEQFTTLALRLAQRAVVLQRGRAAWCGPAQTLRDTPEILQASYLA
ncbi:ABC transporter ATP-binding protein [Variovorax fucosicus]|uniref:ABC transporter ATP-binding protein n=1 Tax=Variovorax fucosicus TaxID=3053517 RepID=UPI00257785BC|nr:ATP-binding cassette domain-containing protein [Variovorax sp. J22G47]MDM0056870.1 ATP-binding cassette domain-containing protein [Variovorax sp. J22G47]